MQMNELVWVALVLCGVIAALLVVVIAKLSPIHTAATKAAEAVGRVENLESGLTKVEAAVREGLAAERDSRATESRATREELRAAMMAQTESTLAQLGRAAEAEKRQLDTFATQLQSLTEANERRLTEIRSTVEAKLKETIESDRQGRADAALVLKELQDALAKQLDCMSGQQRTQLEGFSKQLSDLMTANDRRMEALRQAVDERLKAIQDNTNAKLEQMRATVDEKLQTTLERRLGESFRLVSERLENVQRGLGEMQALATDVGDLKKVLANVKTRGGWGEVQLGALLEEILTPEQYAINVKTKKGSNAQVEFAIRLPGPQEDPDSTLWLPIDAKFPREAYERLIDAQERADIGAMDEAGKEMEASVKLSAKEVHDKYLDPPNTTDFALMFVPTEGLYAELLRRPGLAAQLQREQRVILTGPMTLAALLNSLQMGFRTLAITKRSSEVWLLLGAIKTEFGYFGDVLSKVQKKLQEASNTIESAESRTRVIQRRLRSVQELPASEAAALLPVQRAVEDESGEMRDSHPLG